MRQWAIAALVIAACAKKQEAAPHEAPAVPAVSAEEAQRGRDACGEYVKRVCACSDTVPAVKQQCDLARAMPDAVRLGLEVAASPDSKPNDVIGAQKAMRQAVKECIEQTAKLPTLGCS